MIGIFPNIEQTYAVQPSISQILKGLYGEAIATSAERRLQELVAGYHSRIPTPTTRRDTLPLTQSDALLITYGDQVRDGSIPPLRMLSGFAAAHLKNVVSGIHILPFYPWSSDDGFSVKDFFAVDPALGDWKDVEKLGEDFDLMFDAVFNHMSAQGDWFQRFLKEEPKYRDFFVTVEGNPNLSEVVRPRALPLLTEFPAASGMKKVWTTFSADQVDLNVKNPEVLLALLDALLSYVAHGAKFIRLDAIAYLWKEIGTPCIHLPQTHAIIQLMRAVLDDVAPNVMLITETNVPHTDNISYFGDGNNEAQLVYNFALPPLVLHSIATNNAEKLTHWAQSLVLPSEQCTFFNFLSSHDGIGVNPARGILDQSEIDALVTRTQAHGGFVSYKNNSDGTKSPYELNITYFDALSNPEAHENIERQVERFLVAHAIMLSLAGMPGIYFHSLFGSRNDRAAAEASKIPRRINRQKLQRADMEADLQNPTSLRSQVFSGFKQLLEMRSQHEAFSPSSTQEVLNIDPRVFAVMRESSDGRSSVLCLHNVGNDWVQLSLRDLGLRNLSLAPYEWQWIVT
jgi:glycosidase